MPIGITHLGETLSLDSENNEATANTITVVPTSDEFPIIVSSRFTYIKRLGRGSSGLVYQAFDNVLQRHVALKFLLNNQQNNQTKLVAEARSQANVEHPNICPIYEVIETDNSVYLVMQFIEGKSLQDLAATLSLEQILLLLKKATLALHTAHSQGMIHRDFKPANVMINLGSAYMEPMVVDFGLAAQSDAQEKKSSGIVGTQGFISPELYKNKLAKVDRRCDVYSLGASLLYSLTGIVLSIEKNESLTHELLKTNLPKDVQVIISKSMASEPANRYQSALELAQDITCYLAGDPIKARSGRAYWLMQKLIKHKWLTIAACIAIVGMSAMQAKQLYQQHLQSIKEQALLAINSQIKELEYQAQLTYLSPLHNIEVQQQQWRDEAKQLVQQLPEINPILLGATHYAIGRIYHVLGENLIAAQHFEQAHQMDKSEDAAFYLAISYGQLYHQQLTTLRNIADKKVRNFRITKLDEKYRIPATTLLNDHIDSAPYRSYAEALLAYFQRDWDTAINILNNGEDLPVWYYLDDILQGDILLAKASAMHESGSDIALVSPLVHEASDHYKKAVEIAPSDSFVALKLISTTVFQLKILNQAGKLVAPDLILDIQKVRHDILSITSINGDVYHAFGLFYLYYALNLHYNNGLPQPWFDLAESHFISATNHSTTSGNIWLSFARLYSFIVKFQRELNLDTSESTQKAIDALSNVPDNARDYYYFNEIGTLNRYQAMQVRDNKGDATHLFKIAIFNYIEANRRFPEHIGSLINAASATIKMSVDYLVEDKYVALQEAKLILARVLDKEPSHFVANYYLSIIYIDLFELSLYQGFAIDGIAKEAASQMSRTKLVNKVHPYVLDLEQKLKQFELEKAFSDAGQWNSGFDELIALRIQLAEKFQRNPIVTRNLIGVLCGITGIRIQLGLPAASYVKKIEQALKQYPEFENVDAYRALSQLFSHWHDPDIAKLNLITEFKLRHKSSFAHQWALAMVLLATAQNQQAIDEAVELLNTNHGILPAYRQLILKWADEKAQMLNKKPTVTR